MRIYLLLSLIPPFSHAGSVLGILDNLRRDGFVFADLPNPQGNGHGVGQGHLSVQVRVQGGVDYRI